MLLSYTAQTREPQAVLVVGDGRWSDRSLRSANKSELLWHKSDAEHAAAKGRTW